MNILNLLSIIMLLVLFLQWYSQSTFLNKRLSYLFFFAYKYFDRYNSIVDQISKYQNGESDKLHDDSSCRYELPIVIWIVSTCSHCHNDSNQPDENCPCDISKRSCKGVDVFGDRDSAKVEQSDREYTYDDESD